MKTVKIYLILIAVLSLAACNDFLNIEPKGIVSDEQLKTPENIEKMVIAAYSLLENDNRNQSPWLFANMRSGDAYKGGGGPGDMSWVHNFETFVPMHTNIPEVNDKWIRTYAAIYRTNEALRLVNAIDADTYVDADGVSLKNIRAGEMRFLRAHHAFELKTIFKHIVWVDETMSAEDLTAVSNRQLTDAQLWDKIIEDFRFAADNIRPDNKDIGRANKYTAKAYLAKALIYAAYEQDEHHNVVNINPDKLAEVVSLVSELEAHYDLADDFAENFLWEYENGAESILAIQSSHDDGSDYGRLNQAAMLNYPMSAEYGCCGFHQPSQDLVNAFKTDANGLPLFDTYNESNITVAADLRTHNIDPRLLHTVAIPGAPYKYRASYTFDSSFVREPVTYGAFMSMKETVIYDCPCFKKAMWFYSSSLNRDIIRFDDALLWKAEALIELGRQNEALPIINRIRQRAAQSTSLLVNKDGLPTAQFHIGTYEDGKNCQWTQAFARQALRWERRLEMAMEPSRGFDLVRWGIAAETITSYLTHESTFRTHLQEAKYTKNRDEYYPIPYQQINFSKRLYQQNPGWPAE